MSGLSSFLPVPVFTESAMFIWRRASPGARADPPGQLVLTRANYTFIFIRNSESHICVHVFINSTTYTSKQTELLVKLKAFQNVLVKTTDFIRFTCCPSQKTNLLNCFYMKNFQILRSRVVYKQRDADKEGWFYLIYKRIYMLCH